MASASDCTSSTASARSSGSGWRRNASVAGTARWPTSSPAPGSPRSCWSGSSGPARSARSAARRARRSGSCARAPGGRELLWQLREVAGAAKGRPIAGPAASRPLDLRLPATAAPDLPPPSELERLGDSYAILSLDARRQVIELFRPALDRLGAVSAARLAEHPPGRVAIGGLVVTRQHPMTANGDGVLAVEGETGMGNVTLC